MKTKIYILFLFAFTLFQFCNARQSQSALLKVENHLNGELDYTHEALEIVERQHNGQEIILGTINKDGTIHFNLPEFDIKGIYDSINLQQYKLQSFFRIDSGCKDQDPFAKTPVDDVYAQKYKLLIKKYGINVAILEPTSESLPASSTYFWMYIDSAITFKENCTKISSRTNDMYADISANIEFNKGWNFIEENLEIVKTDSNGDSLTTQLSKRKFTKISPSDKKIKWFLRQIQEDEKIATAQRLDKLKPITEKQFEKWIPNKLGDLTITTKEHGNPPKGQKNKNNIHVVYANKTKTKEIDLYVVDCAKSPNDMEMVNFSYAMENRGKEEKDIKPYVSQYSERKKAMQFLYKVDDRIIVNASGVNINAEDLWSYIKKLNVKKLLKK